MTGCAGASKEALDPTGGDKKAAAPATTAYVEDDLAGRSADHLDDLLGAATLTRREGAGEFRRYDFVACAVMLVLYPDETGVNRVEALRAGALSADAPAPDLADCLATGR
ncbi:MAG: hypothetical protein AAF224_00765 [Pseudomonadota bacterium]